MERQKFTRMMDLSERMYLRSGGKEWQTREISVIDMMMKSAREKKKRNSIFSYSHKVISVISPSVAGTSKNLIIDAPSTPSSHPHTKNLPACHTRNI